MSEIKHVAETWMALQDTLKCNSLTPLRFKWLTNTILTIILRRRKVRIDKVHCASVTFARGVHRNRCRGCVYFLCLPSASLTLELGPLKPVGVVGERCKLSQRNKNSAFLPHIGRLYSLDKNCFSEESDHLNSKLPGYIISSSTETGSKK